MAEVKPVSVEVALTSLGADDGKVQQRSLLSQLESGPSIVLGMTLAAQPWERCSLEVRALGVP